MALPLEPESGLFPDLDVPPFVRAPELAELAWDVLRSFDEFTAVRRAIEEGSIVVGYVWETKPFDPLKDELKPHTIAKVTKASPLWRALAEVDLVIQFREWFWDLFDDHERRGVLHHEWSHVEFEAGKVSLREHDVEEFSKTARRFGPRRGHHAALFKAFLDWQHEQERPEPTPIRPVEAIAADAVLDAAADPTSAAAAGLRDLAERRGEDITVSAGGRTATIRGRKRDDHADEIRDEPLEGGSGS